MNRPLRRRCVLRRGRSSLRGSRYRDQVFCLCGVDGPLLTHREEHELVCHVEALVLVCCKPLVDHRWHRPTMHTPGCPVCTNGRAIARIGLCVSVSAHAVRPRVQRRTRPALIGPARVRKSTRRMGACAKSDAVHIFRPPTCPHTHTAAPVACIFRRVSGKSTCGRCASRLV